MTYNLKEFGKRLSEMIENRYLTQAKFSRKSKIDKANISLYCNGKKKASPETIVKICATLDCSPDWLTKGNGSKDDTFQLSAIYTIEKQTIPNVMSATRIHDFIEIRFIVPQKEFSNFIANAKINGCLSV